LTEHVDVGSRDIAEVLSCSWLADAVVEDQEIAVICAVENVADGGIDPALGRPGFQGRPLGNGVSANCGAKYSRRPASRFRCKAGVRSSTPNATRYSVDRGCFAESTSTTASVVRLKPPVDRIVGRFRLVGDHVVSCKRPPSLRIGGQGPQQRIEDW